MQFCTKEVRSIMAEIENSIAQCCKQLRLSTNFAGQALTLEGDTPQKYLLNLLENEISYRVEKRKSKYLNTAGFPRRYRAGDFKTCLTWIFIMQEKMSSCMEAQEPAKRCCQY